MKVIKLTSIFMVLICALTVNAGLFDRIKALKDNIVNMFTDENKE